MIISEDEAVKNLIAGGVIGIPTDTVFGLASLNEYKEKIYILKNRDHNKKLINFIHIYKQIGSVDNLPEEKVKYFANKYWPGQTTLIFLQNKNLISYRIPNNKDVLSLLSKIKVPLVTTSANISGQSPITSIDEFEEKFPDIPLLESKFIQKSSKKPSQILIVSERGIERIR